MVHLDGMLYPGLFCGGCWVAILCSAMSVNFFNSTAFQGRVLYQEIAVLAWCWYGEMKFFLHK